MKIGEVAKRTGLTEKAIRVYVDNGLVTPTIEQTTHRNSYDFTEENVRELEHEAVLLLVYPVGGQATDRCAGVGASHCLLIRQRRDVWILPVCGH